MRGVLVLCGVLLAVPAFGYTAPPVTSFAKPTADGKHTLVMLHTDAGGHETELNKKYARSGLYPTGDPTKPRWVCDWKAAREWGVFASDDGVYAVRVPDGDPGLRHWLLSSDPLIPPRAAGWDDAPALFIYMNGRLERTLALKDVFNTAGFTDRDCFLGPVVTIESFRNATGRVTIVTSANDRTLTAQVDFRTGEVSGRGGRTPEPPDGDVLKCGNTGPDDETDAPASVWRWGRVILIGLAVVGVGTAAFVGLAVMLIRGSAFTQRG